MPRFSVVTVYNDKKVLENWLLDSLTSQSSDLFETVLVDNREGKYDSASAALNAGAERASGEYYLFVHQDVRFLGDSWFENALKLLESISNLGIAGVSGVVSEGESVPDATRNVIYHGRPPEDFDDVNIPSGFPNPRVTPNIHEITDISTADYDSYPVPDLVQPRGRPIEKPVQVQTLDELLFIIPSEVFEENPLDSEICDGWHLYAAEYSLRINSQEGLSVYALPLPVWHRSTGPLDSNYFRALDRVVANCGENFPPKMYHTTGIHPLRRSYSFPRRFWPLKKFLFITQLITTGEILDMFKTAMKKPDEAVKWIKWHFLN